jgi:polyisoprenoid-binding protein YceI
MTTQTEQGIPTGTWNADTVHSDIGFAVDYMSGTFQGGFSDFNATVADGNVRGEAQVASIQVKDPNLEAHLQAPDFFDAENHPTLTFESKDVSGSDDNLTIAGELTIKGHTEPVEITASVTEPIADPFGNERFGLKLETTVDRTKFGLNWNNPLPSGEPALQNDVKLIADLQFVQPTEA